MAAMRILLAAVLLIHGVAHVVGFVVPWRIVTSSEVPYRTTLLNGSVDVGAAGVRLVGIVWLVMALLFVSLAASVLRETTGWSERAFVLVGVSLMLCVLGLPESFPGVLVNGVILTLLFVGLLLNSYPEVGS